VVYKVNPDGSNFQVIYTFKDSDGAYPYAGVIQGSDGALYGTTEFGGANGDGVVYKVNPDGSNFQVIHTFSALNNYVNSDGAYPTAGVIQGSDGALYGTTNGGGANGYGVVYKVNPDGSNFQVLYTFTGGNDGAYPYAGVIQGRDGALYGTTYGGFNNYGVVFKVNPDGSNFQVLYTFSGGNDGAHPSAGVIQGRDGALYGTTEFGGANGYGVVYKVNPDGSNFQVLHTFSALDNNRDNPDGANPTAGVIQGSDGALYGTTEFGGANGYGVVFKVNPDGSNFQVIYTFTDSDGANPNAGVIQGRDGALYGTTEFGGSNNYGVVYKVNPDGSNFQVIYTFTDSDGANPNAGVIQGSDGALYGTTVNGGSNGDGVVFKVNPDGSNFQVLYTFTGGNDGAYPYAGVIQGRDGALYGTTPDGGANGFGVLFKVNPDGSNFQVLHSFSYNDGANPYAGVIQGRDGALYGTTEVGGANGVGVVYKVNPDGSNFQVLYTFTGGSDGANPTAGVIQSRDGALYGTTVFGGSNNYGVVFKVNPDGSNFQVIYTFKDSDGAYPSAGVIQGSDGALYGTTPDGGVNGDGVVYKVNPDGSNFQVIYTFKGSDGANPEAGVIQGKDGALYGTTYNGGSNGDGVVYKVNPDGSNFQVLHTFSALDNNSDNPDGALPYAGVIQGRNGNLYGTTNGGGADGLGVIFRIGPQALFLNPNNAPAGSNNLTLTLLGNGFAQNDTLLWNGTTSITPTSVSADGTQIQATIPANLLINPGSATLQVQDPNIHNTTSPLVLLIGAAQIHLQIHSIARDGNNNVVVTLTITNTGGATASNLAVTLATLTDSTKQKFNTSSSLPMSLGTLSAGGSVSATLVFPSTAASGSGLLQVRGSYGGGSFGGSFRVTVP
jgi:uncharacterized repeat protein (TIGR03803 family)